MTYQYMEEQYQLHQQKMTRVFQFLQDHRHLKEDLPIWFNAKALLPGQPAKERIRKLFLDAMSAAGGRNLERSGPSCAHFAACLSRLPDNDAIRLADFYRCFAPAVTSFASLFMHLSTSNAFGNFGNKKAALFLNKLHWLQHYQSQLQQPLFLDYAAEEMDLQIPVDVVITFLLNLLLGFPVDNLLKENHSGDFGLINRFFKDTLGPMFMLVEDFWFWGYFTTVKETFTVNENGQPRKKSRRYLAFNQDKYHTADFIVPTNNLKNAMLEFIALIREGAQVDYLPEATAA